MKRSWLLVALVIRVNRSLVFQIVGCGTILVVVLLGLRFMTAGCENQWTSALSIQALDGRAAQQTHVCQRVHPDSGKVVLVLDE